MCYRKIRATASGGYGLVSYKSNAISTSRFNRISRSLCAPASQAQLGLQATEYPVKPNFFAKGKRVKEQSDTKAASPGARPGSRSGRPDRTCRDTQTARNRRRSTNRRRETRGRRRNSAL